MLLILDRNSFSCNLSFYVWKLNIWSIQGQESRTIYSRNRQEGLIYHIPNVT